METEFEKISRKTGRKESFCKCVDCKKQCTSTPGLATPAEIAKIIEAGYGDRLKLTVWRRGLHHGFLDHDIDMIQPLFDTTKKACTFFTNGLCELHDKSLKPTECRLSHHSTRLDNFKFRKSISWHVAHIWEDEKNVYEKLVKLLA